MLLSSRPMLSFERVTQDQVSLHCGVPLNTTSMVRAEGVGQSHPNPFEISPSHADPTKLDTPGSEQLRGDIERTPPDVSVKVGSERTGGMPTEVGPIWDGAGLDILAICQTSGQPSAEHAPDVPKLHLHLTTHLLVLGQHVLSNRHGRRARQVLLVEVAAPRDQVVVIGQPAAQAHRGGLVCALAAEAVRLGSLSGRSRTGWPEICADDTATWAPARRSASNARVLPWTELACVLGPAQEGH